jgi:hypothetical protein
MNSYQVFDLGDIVCLRDGLTIKDFVNINNKRIVEKMLSTIMTIYVHSRFCEDTFDNTFDNTYVQIIDIIDEEHLLVIVTDSDKELLIDKRFFIHMSFIDKDTLRTIFIDKNTKKRVRRHDNKLKNNNYGKSKFFHKDKFERK